VRSSNSADARNASFDGLAKVGLPALPAIRQAIKTLKPDDPARSKLEGLAARIALTVTDVRFAANSAKPSDDLRCLVESYRSKPVTCETFMKLLSVAAGKTLQSTRGIKIRLERPGDDRGASLLVTLVNGLPSGKGTSPQLSTQQTIVVDGTAIRSEFGSMAGIDRTAALAETYWKEFSAGLQTALQSRPEQHLLIQAECQEMRSR
jgi:hypothetical protein